MSDAGTPAESITGKEVLVTGGAGFIGSHLVGALVDENDVTVLDDLSGGSKGNVHPDATLVQGDLRNRDTVEAAVEGMDLIFHLAGLVSVEASVANPTKSHAINAGGTVTLLDCARDVDARVITASSAAIYGEPTATPVDERQPLTPQSPYAVDKRTVDEYTRLFAELYGLETVALRYFNVYGPGQSAASYSGVISTFLEQAAEGSSLTIHGDGTQTRDFVHVTDVVRANLLAATADSTGNAYNIGTGEETSIARLAEIVRSVGETSPEIVHVGERQGDVAESCADISRARGDLSYEPTVDLRDGLDALMRESNNYTPESDLTPR